MTDDLFAVDENGRYRQVTQEQWERLMNAPITEEREADAKKFETWLENFEPPAVPVDYSLEVKCDEILTQEEVDEIISDIKLIPQNTCHDSVAKTKTTVIRNEKGQVVKEIIEYEEPK